MHDEVTIGNYNRNTERKDRSLHLEMTRGEFMSTWNMCGTIANFFSNYAKFSYKNQDEAENSLSTIFNELIENAVKFSADDKSTIVLELFNYEKSVIFNIVNETLLEQYASFREYAEDLISTQDLSSEYLRVIEQNATSEHKSGIGLLLVSNLLQTHLAFKFNFNGKERIDVAVQTNVIFR